MAPIETEWAASAIPSEAPTSGQTRNYHTTPFAWSCWLRLGGIIWNPLFQHYNDEKIMHIWTIKIELSIRTPRSPALAWRLMWCYRAMILRPVSIWGFYSIIQLHEPKKGTWERQRVQTASSCPLIAESFPPCQPSSPPHCTGSPAQWTCRETRAPPPVINRFSFCPRVSSPGITQNAKRQAPSLVLPGFVLEVIDGLPEECDTEETTFLVLKQKAE